MEGENGRGLVWERVGKSVLMGNRGDGAVDVGCGSKTEGSVSQGHSAWESHPRKVATEPRSREMVGARGFCLSCAGVFVAGAVDEGLGWAAEGGGRSEKREG